ncbi:hypothetical protein D3C75_575170 [compost metagenome]
MKLHTDDTLEGTPEELAAYMSLKQPEGARLCNWPPFVTDKTQSGATGIATGTKYPGEGTIYTTVPSQARYDPFEYHKLEAKAQCDANAAKCIK